MMTFKTTRTSPQMPTLHSNSFDGLRQGKVRKF